MKSIIQKSALALMLCLPLSLQAKVEHLLPKPQQVSVTQGSFALSGSVTINYSGDAQQCALLEEFFTSNGCTIATGGKAVNVTLVESIEGAHDYELHGYENEAYTLEITSSAINITAVTGTGVIRAAQTLTQLAEGYEGEKALEGLTMKDWPAFKLRGYMHDVGRSFISIDELIKQVELFSRFKINTFHWHMTENQAWRFEVKAYPELTSSASMTRFPGQYYTQEDCKRLLAVAKKHGVIVIPEIDMPGHSEAFERAMGFGMQTEEGKAVLKKVIDEVVAVFEGVPYLHIGGDEVSTTAAYLNEMLDYAESKGTNVKGGLWNPINGIGQDALNHTLAQMWGTRGYLATGKANIDCRYNYTNHFDVFADLVGIYKSNIYYHAKGTPEVAGAISGCWNDRKVADEVAIMAQNNVWANVIATAERTWMGGGKRYIDNMTNTPNNLKVDGGHGGVMLPNSGDEFEEFKSWETRFLFHKANSLKGEPIPYVKQTNVRWRITDAFPNGGSETAAFGPETAGVTASTDLLPETFTHDGQTYYSGIATGAGIYLAHTWGNSIINAYYKNPQFNHTAYAWTYVYSDKEQKVGAQIEFQNYSRSEQDAAAPAGKWDHFGSKIWVNGEEIAAPTWDNTGVSVNNKEVMLKNENFPGRKPIQVTLKQGWNKVFLKLPYFNKGYRLKKWMFTCVFTDLEGINAVDGLIYSPNQCMDEATEVVAAKISEIKRDRGNLIGTSVGLWPESAAATLDAKVKEVEDSYADTNITAEQRKAQVTALETAWTAFVASLTEANMNQPVSGNYYRMYTPLRANRYATGNGADAAITGPTEATTKASIWQFVKRSDNAYDIINVADGTYISPASNNNTALKTVIAQPTAGWSIKKAENTGNVIVVSGTAQFNQQKDGNLHLLNWGSGTNTTDDGCEYRLINVTDQIPPQPFVKIEGLSSQSYPYAIDEALAQKVFAKENLTIAIDVMTPASMSGRQALVCAADPTKAVTGATKNNSPYVAYGLYGSNPVYLPSSSDGDRFTYRDFGFTGNTKYKVVYVIDRTNKKFAVYVDGALKSSADYPISGYELQSFSNFASNANAKLYIGGGVVSTNAQYDKFGGQVRSVQFFDSALSAEKVAELEYPVVPEDVILDNAVTAHANMNIYGLQRYLGLVQNAGTGLEGNGQFVCNYPASTSQESGNAYTNLIDGNYETFFHSGYGSTIGSGSHYLQADLGKAVNSFRFYTRKRNDNDRPTKITIEGSNDATTWTLVKVVENIPTNAPDYYSEEISSETAYQHYRFTVNTTNTNKVFYTFSEFYILPSDYTKVNETFEAVRAYRANATLETATELNKVYAWNKGLTEGSPVVGVESYLYVDTYKDEKFVNRFLYNNNGTLTPTTELQRGATAFLWTPAVKEDGKYNFKNKVAKYLAHKGMSDNEHNFTVAATTHHMGVTLHTQGNNYFVVKNADGTFDQSSETYDQKTTNYCTDFVFIPADLYDRNFEPVAIKSAEEFKNGGIYTFVTKRGWMGATASSNNVISTARTTVEPAASATNTYFQWAVYKSAKGNYYLYNIGKGKYMGVQSNNNASVPFVDAPNNKQLTFKQSSSTDYPIMFSTDNAGVVNHTTVHGTGLVNWTDGWSKLTDEGSNHQVMLVGELTTAELQAIADLVDESEADEIQLFVKAEVEGLDASNPNTHFGNISVTSKFGGQSVKLKRNPEVVSIGYLDTPTTTINFTRAYRGFEFQGFFLGEENLGMSFSPSEIEELTTSETTPLVAKFTTTADVTLFYDDDEYSYRIPAIGKTSTGRLIAVSDYRHNLDDIGRDVHGTGKLRLDLVMRYSDDNGKTWSAKQTIAEGTGNKNADGYDCAYGDAAIATVGQNVLVMAAAGNVVYNGASDTKHNRTVRVFSADNGLTWTKEDISEKIFIGESALIPNGHAAFFGSGKLAVDANFNGTGKARIYGAMLVKNTSTTTNIYPIYTDDLGQNWKILGGSTSPVANADEPKVEILPNGQILLSARRQGGRVFRVFTYGAEATDKTNGSGSWGEEAANGCGNTGSNGTNGEIFLVDAQNANGDAVKLLMQSQPKGGSGHYDRKDVTIWYKEVDANTTYTTTSIKDGWTQGLQVSTQQSSYSAMTLQADGKIAFFFEEAPCYGDDYTKGYCMVYVPLTIEAITKDAYKTPEVKEEGGEEIVSADALPGDGTLRFYRLAIPVTESAYEQDLKGSKDNVLAFWQECEEFVNQMFVPLGFCFDVVEDDKLIDVTDFTIGNSGLPEIGNCTYVLNDILGEANYDVAMWVTHRDDAEENSGLSALGGAYTSSQKGSGYAKTDKWVVAHELGHMFGAVHTLQGEGSLMDNQGEYFSYPSIKAIRNSAIGTTSHNNVKVANNAPQFDIEKMQQTYRIPQGACLAIDVQATDIEEHKLMYTAIGCTAQNVDNIQEGKDVNLPFASFAPQESNVISYAPQYTADLVYDDYFYLKEGTGIHEMEPGTYPLSILVNDVPETVWNSEELATNPFYSTYAIWETQVQVVAGDSFSAALSPVKDTYTAGETITVNWGANEAYFTADSKVRISLSTDYGKTFNYVLAEAVTAIDGTCTVMLPNCNIGTVAVDFGTATRTMNGGVIKVEEMGSGVFTLTALDPNTHKGFTVTGATDEEDAVSTTLSSYGIGTFYANAAMTIPEGITAYVATSLPEMEGTEGTITLTALTEGIIPAKTGCVIRGAEGAYTFTKAATAGTLFSENLLRGYAGTAAYEEVAVPEDGSVNYVLTTENGAVGFYRKAAGFKVYNHKAYLNVPSAAQRLSIRFNNGDGTTDIVKIPAAMPNKETIVYDLQGRRVTTPSKGVYIINGQKRLF
ncbi:MAG: family 20 glycosylhydrolase [Bacteroidaceae bacterium]|nr:family 20 glycosylhydrolase [Bacteroidaceae bacterium]